jgi:hypothetical protein
MSPEEARAILCKGTRDDNGTFTTLRLGEDPGRERVHELRLALRVLWRYWKAHDALPFDIAQQAAVILHFQSAAEQNLAARRHASPSVTTSELWDLAQGTFELLSGRVAERDAVRRPDLDE